MGKRLTIVFTLAVLSVSSVMAQNTMFLRKSPISHLNETDRKILRETIDELLVSPDGTVSNWENPETGSGGRVKVLDTEQTNGLTCRNIRARNQARGRQADGIYRLCKEADGKWRFAPTDKSSVPETTTEDTTQQEAN
jgi:surface antigen